MSEAEVAQQLIADLQANIGVISGFIIVLLLGGVLALGTTLSKASRAMRDLRSDAAEPRKGVRMAYGGQMAYAGPVVCDGRQGVRETGPSPAAARFAARAAAPSRPVGRELPLARRNAPRHQGRGLAASETRRRPRRTGDRHSLI